MALKSLRDPVFGENSTDNTEALTKLGLDLAGKRDKAILARKESGIEDMWTQCEESYLAIDDSNRHEFTGAKWAKPTSMTGGITANYGAGSKKSSAFVRLTSRYVDMGAAKVGEILLPVDDKAFHIDSTPIPELIKQKDDKTQVAHPITGQPMMRPATPEEIAAMPPQVQAPQGQPGQPGAATPGPPMVPITAADVAEKVLAQAEDAAKRAETRIYDWMVECNFPAEMRKLIHDSARIGVGVLKAPTPVMVKSQAVTKTAGGVSLEIVLKAVPAVVWKDPWNIFPHGACGENINDGDHIFERDYLSPSQIKALKSDPTYLPDQIDRILEEGPGKVFTEGRNPAEKKNKDRYEVWYFIGTISRSDMMLTNAIGKDELPDEIEDVFAICTLINDSVVRAVLNPLESGSFGYHAMPWSRRSGHWAGVGVAEQISMPQRMVNGATRALMNNAGLSGGLQIVLNQLGVVPADGDWAMTPNKFWYVTAEAIADDVRKLFAAIEFPNVGPQMQAIIEYAFKLAEEACNIPLISQGQTNQHTPDTFGAAELQNNNANTLLRNIAQSFDDHITEPVVKGFYEWLLLDPEVPDDEKGDFKINAKGSIAMVEKAIQEQTMAQILQMSLNPAFRADPKKCFESYLRAKRLDPRQIQYSPEEIAKMDAAPPTPPLPLLVEQQRGQNALQIQQAKSQAELQMEGAHMQAEQQRLASGQATPHMATASARVEEARIRANSLESIEASRAQTELAYAQSEAQVSRDNANARIQELQLKRELAILDYTQKHNLTIQQTQAELAKTAMQERTKRELAAADLALQQAENHKDRQHQVSLANAETTSQQLANET